MDSVGVVTLGAGGEVGRSCFLIRIAEITVMIDAGVHLTPGKREERVPILPTDTKISGVIITHYHLDHIGALPYLTEVQKSIAADCEIFMTAPTKTLAIPLLLDYAGGPNSDLYFPNHVWSCFTSNRIKQISAGEEFRLRSEPNFAMHAVHAGHVVGGIMLFIKYRGICVVYTGDFSVVPDSLLNPISIPPNLLGKADVVITESTHATTVSNKSLLNVEKEICEKISKAIRRGGRVLIPVFAVGRTQELAALVRSNLGSSVQLFTSSPAGQKASILTWNLHKQWIRANSSVQVKVLAETESLPPGSVLFASPAMIEGGASLRHFVNMCEDPHNLVLLTGYCNKETVGNSVILFASRHINDRTVTVNNQKLQVNCECHYVPFSNHTDSVGIVDVLRKCNPNIGIVLVHGQREKMERFRAQLRTIFKPSVRIEIPNNYESLEFSVVPKMFSHDLPAEETVEKKFPVAGSRVVDIIRSEFPDWAILDRHDGAIILDNMRRYSLEVVDEDKFTTVLYRTRPQFVTDEWIRYNPMFVGLERILEKIDLDGISECSN